MSEVMTLRTAKIAIWFSGQIGQFIGWATTAPNADSDDVVDQCERVFFDTQPIKGSRLTYEEMGDIQALLSENFNWFLRQYSLELKVANTSGFSLAYRVSFIAQI